jgi:general secretion pathway protein J
MWPTRNSRRSRGFTLIEILIAIAIFAVLAGMAYRALSAVLEARRQVEIENRKWRSIAFAMIRLEQDLGGAINRPVRDPSGQQQAAFVGLPVAPANGGMLMLTRRGDLDALGYETPPVRVGYRLSPQGVLEQLNWGVLDQAPGSQPIATPLLDGIGQLEFAYAGPGGQISPIWPPGLNAPQPIPSTVAVRLSFTSGQQISRVFAIGPPITSP